MPSLEDEPQNTDCVDTEEYEDSISDPNTINGDNIPLDNELVDIPKPTKNLMSIDDTMIVNVGNVLTQGTTNGDNKTSYLNDITSCDVMNGDNETLCLNGDTSCDNMNGQNTDLNRDTNGHNTLKFVSDPNNDTDTNSHNNNESTPLSSTENRDGISPSPPSSNVSNILDEDNPHRETRVYGTVKVHNQILDLWLYKAETRKIYVSVPKLSDKDIQRWINPASAKPSWQDLDPYSSLEEIVSDDDSNIQLDTANQLYNMRERKPKNIPSRPHRNRKEINYIDLCDDNTDPPSPKHPKQ